MGANQSRPTNSNSNNGVCALYTFNKDAKAEQIFKGEKDVAFFPVSINFEECERSKPTLCGKFIKRLKNIDSLKEVDVDEIGFIGNNITLKIEKDPNSILSFFNEPVAFDLELETIASMICEDKNLPKLPSDAPGNVIPNAKVINVVGGYRNRLNRDVYINIRLPKHYPLFKEEIMIYTELDLINLQYRKLIILHCFFAEMYFKFVIRA